MLSESQHTADRFFFEAAMAHCWHAQKRRTAADRPSHTPHAVADLNQSETQNVAIFSADFFYFYYLTRW